MNNLAYDNKKDIMLDIKPVEQIESENKQDSQLIESIVNKVIEEDEKQNNICTDNNMFVKPKKPTSIPFVEEKKEAPPSVEVKKPKPTTKTRGALRSRKKSTKIASERQYAHMCKMSEAGNKAKRLKKNNPLEFERLRLEKIQKQYEAQKLKYEKQQQSLKTASMTPQEKEEEQMNKFFEFMKEYEKRKETQKKKVETPIQIKPRKPTKQISSSSTNANSYNVLETITNPVSNHNPYDICF